MRFEEAVKTRFKCAKCSSTDCEVESVAMTGTGLTKIFDIQSKIFYAISCKNCGYTEFYSKKVVDGRKGILGDLLDVMFG